MKCDNGIIKFINRYLPNEIKNNIDISIFKPRRIGEAAPEVRVKLKEKPIYVCKISDIHYFKYSYYRKYLIESIIFHYARVTKFATHKI